MNSYNFKYRLVSYYYFLRYGDDFRANKIRSRMGAEKVTFDECIERNYKDRMKREKHGQSMNKCLGGDNTCDCDATKLWLQVPWFCGHFQKCWSPPGNAWALQQAKYNLINKVIKNYIPPKSLILFHLECHKTLNNI